MKQHLKRLSQRAVQNPVLQKSVASLKPDLSILGFFWVILFFIVPELIGFVWGSEISTWAHTEALSEPKRIGRSVYWVLEKLFEDGGSWVNLGIGMLLLLWLGIEWRKSNREGKE